MKSIKDQMGRSLVLPQQINRIVSLVPSQTELLYDLGLGDKIVGITNFCIHPEELYRSRKRVGGTKNFKKERIDALAPDIIIGNKEENFKEGIEALELDYPVWMSDIQTVEDAFEMIATLGQIFDVEQEANQMLQTLRKDFATIDSWQLPHKRVAYFIWKKPYMVAAQNTFIQELIAKLSWTNVFADQSRYPQVSAEQIAEAQPDILLLSSEPYPFKEKDIKEFQELCPHAAVCLVDGEIFSWYGSRLLHTKAYLEEFCSSILKV